MARSDNQIFIRVSSELRDAIQAAAKYNRRSINSELIFTLEKLYMSQNQNGMSSSRSLPAAPAGTAAVEDSVAESP